MDVPKYKLNASVRGVLAQRLLRKVCTGCSIKRPISDNEAREFQIRNNTPIMYAVQKEQTQVKVQHTVFLMPYWATMNLNMTQVQLKIKKLFLKVLEKLDLD